MAQMDAKARMILLIGSKKIIDQKGFTLIEILLVLVLLTVIIGLVIPNFSSTYNSLQLKRMVQDLGYLMRYAQSRAITKQSLVRLEFDDEQKTYWLMQEVKDQEGDIEGSFDRLSGRLGRNYRIPDGIKIQKGEEMILFYPDGQIEKQHLSICNDKKCFTISTKAQRGKVLIFEDELIE